MNILERYEPEEGHTVEDLLLAYEMLRLNCKRLLEIVKKAERHQCCICDSMCCLACEAHKLLEELGESKNDHGRTS